MGKGAGHLSTTNPPDPQVETIDCVPDIVPYLRRATIAVVPILHGSGIRFKILEALACEVPVVSTTLGAQGIEVKDGESILLADSAAAFAQAILTLLQDHAKRAQMARQGLAVLGQHYTASVNTVRIQQLVTEILCARKG
ncbi:MAG: glycosyltransferase [Caldilineaceae bacterium]